MKKYLTLLCVVSGLFTNSFGQLLEIKNVAANLNVKHQGNISCDVNLTNGKIASSGTIELNGADLTFEDMTIECKKLEINSTASFRFSNVTIKCEELVLKSPKLLFEGSGIKCEKRIVIEKTVVDILVSNDNTITTANVSLVGPPNPVLVIHKPIAQAGALLVKYSDILFNNRTINIINPDDSLTFEMKKQ